MQHWYAYHSQKRMGYSYRETNASRLYFKKNGRQIERGDWIWIVEGDLATPTRFSLSDCFEIEHLDPGPFSGEYSRYHGKASASRSLLRYPVPLNRGDQAWFAEMHRGWLTKQRFFEPLASRPDYLAGLRRVAGL